MNVIAERFRAPIGALLFLTLAQSTGAAYSVYATPGAVYLGHWTWNDAGAGTSIVEVRMKAQPPKKPPEKAAGHVVIQNFKIEVGAVAEDGTVVRGSAIVQVPAGSTRSVKIRFDRPLSSLQFIQIKALPRTEVA